MENQATNGKNVAESGIFKKFISKAEDYLKKPSRIKDLLNDAYHKASEKKDVGTIAHEAWESLQTLSRLIKAAVSGEYTGIPTSTIVGGIAVLIYFLSPLDLIPDILPVVGLLDDVALLAWFMSSIKTEIDRFADWEKSNQAQGGAQNNAAAASGGVGATTGQAAPAGLAAVGAPDVAAAANTTTGAVGPAVDPAATTSKYESYDNHDLKASPTQASTNPTDRVPLTKPGEELRIKDFTAHDLDTSETPNDSAIRANTSGSGEPNVRAATTDSTRIPNSNDDDMKAGGNIR